MLGWLLRRVFRLALLVAVTPLWALRAVLGRFGSRRLLHLRLHGPISDVPQPIPIWRRLRRDEPPAPSIAEVLAAFEEVERDGKVAGVVLQLDHAALPLVGAEALLAGIDRLKAAGKKVLVWSADLGAPGLVVAAAADRAYGLAVGQLWFTGLRLRALLLPDLLETLGVGAQVARHGDYKTFADRFTHRELSPAHREMLTDLGGDLYEQVITPLIVGRSLEREAVVATFDDAPVSCEAAVEAGLLDGLAYADELPALGGALTELGDDPATCGVDLPLGRAARRRWLGTVLRDPPRVRTIVLRGAIYDGDDGRGVLAGPTVRELDAAREEKGVKAVVLRIDSPGGSAIASDVIWRAARRLNEEKPVVASMGGVAASGGYYIAAAARRIVAHAATLTGSIGVVSGKLHVAAALRRWGVHTPSVTFGARAGLYDPDRPFTPDELAAIERELMRFYDTFVARVAEGRGMTPSAVDAVAQGRVWTGRRAQPLGLVDVVGDHRRAVAEAADLAGLRSWQLEFVSPRARGGALAAVGLGAVGSVEAAAPGLAGLTLGGLASIDELTRLARVPVLALCPWRPEGI